MRVSHSHGADGTFWQRCQNLYAASWAPADRARYDILGLNGPLFSPTTDLVSFQREVALEGVIPVAGTHDQNFAILQEPIKDGDVGLAMVGGVSIVKVWIASTEANSIYSYAEIQAAAGSMRLAPTGPARVLSIEAGTGTKWALVSFGNANPITWAKATADWSNAAGNASYVEANPCDDGAGTTVDTGSTIKVWLPRNGLQKDPNIRDDAIFPVARADDGNYVCTGEYLDEEIGALKIWHSTTIPAGWQLAIGFGGKFLVCYDAGDPAHDAVGETGGADTHTHAGHANHGDHADHADHADHEAPEGFYPGSAPLSRYAWWDDPPDLSHSSHGSHSVHGSHGAHSAHDTVSNKPEYKTVVLIQRVD